jgi:hypothetical protein
MIFKINWKLITKLCVNFQVQQREKKKLFGVRHNWYLFPIIDKDPLFQKSQKMVGDSRKWKQELSSSSIDFLIPFISFFIF